MTTHDLVEELHVLIKSAHAESEYNPAEDMLTDPFCRRVVEAAAKAAAEIKRLRTRLESAERVVEVMEEIADTENPEHYGNARDALHAVKLKADEVFTAHRTAYPEEDKNAE